ncbi:WD repeat-containing protein 55 [Aplysia californica]|uniref:WD repeat-containing protein 55 n=1 Tax=Aplysia californica TaxID=6500 RepID=A0ABM0JRU1_APLCA|nr:WD repeat-containing protein 55 [Aplysia californica]
MQREGLFGNCLPVCLHIKKQEQLSPSDLVFEDLVTTVKCHPSESLIASGLINGEVYLHSYSCSEESKQIHKFTHHKKSCRAMGFTDDGRRLYSVSKDKSIFCVDVHTGKLKRKIKKAHESPIYSVVVTGDTFIATGDDDGLLKVWDMRTKEATMEMKECEDFISDMIVEDNKKIVIAASGEGTLTSFNIRRRRVELQSELFDSELLCLARMKGGGKLVCGTSEGVLNIFNWGQWGNISDRFPCGQDQVDSLVPITDNVVCAGTSDGNIQAVHVLPNRVLGLVGQHMEDFPVESLTLTSDLSCVASCSHDQKVKFWNIEELKSQTVDTSKRGTKQAKKNKVKFGKAKQNDFFSGLVDSAPGSGDTGADDNSDDDSDDDSD